MRKRIQRRQQVPMSFSRRGGARIGAGRPKSPTSGVPHLARPALSGREPVHVTMRVCEHVFQLRSRRCFTVIRTALAAGCDGVIASGLEVSGIKAKFGEKLLAVVPGIRPAGTGVADQKRTVDVAQAFANGADYIVVGRPIRDAADPAAAAEAIQATIARVFSS
jgi:hypothetical protein